METRRAKRQQAARRGMLAWGLAYVVALLLVASAPLGVPALLAGGDTNLGGAVLGKAAEWRAWLLSDRAKEEHPRIAVVVIRDSTLESYPYLVPTDRGLLARIISEVDAARPKAIGLDFFFAQPTEPDKDAAFVRTVQGAKAEVVLGALDERVAITRRQREYQSRFLAETGRKVGFLNLRVELDGVVRYVARPRANSAYPDSFAQLLGRVDGSPTSVYGRVVAWLRPPEIGNAFLVLPAEAVLPGTPEHAKAVADGSLGKLAGRVVIIGGDFASRDRHATPFAFLEGSTPGVLVHTQIIAALLDERVYTNLLPGSAALLLVSVGFLGLALGWLCREAVAIGYVVWGMATLAIVLVDAAVFSQLRIIFPFVLLVIAWYFGVKAGHAFGRVGPWRLEAPSSSDEVRTSAHT